MFKSERSLKWYNFHTLVFDFDGVFTDNKVYTSNDGSEFVKCDRGDGLAFDILRNFIRENKWDLDYFILTKETNKVVTKRAEKLKIKSFHSVNNKLKFIKSRLSERFKEYEESKKGLIYLGNDLNDYESMRFAGLSVAPKDANNKILEIADIVLEKNGGEAFVRDFIEILIDLSGYDDTLLGNLTI